jgi:hypothetical protein
MYGRIKGGKLGQSGGVEEVVWVAFLPWMLGLAIWERRWALPGGFASSLSLQSAGACVLPAGG